MAGSKISLFLDNPVFKSLSRDEQEFIAAKAEEYSLSFQYIKKMTDIASDLSMWDEGTVADIWEDPEDIKLKGKNRAKYAMDTLEAGWNRIKTGIKDYSGFTPEFQIQPERKYVLEEDDNTIIGRCPVASDRTRCCNLQTLDAVKNCGFGCSYCSIQSFYSEGKIIFQKDFAGKLDRIKLDKNRIYHIGTGQSSDSLMWGNKEGILDALFSFARRNPNVILELKTKSGNVRYLKDHDIPPNVIATWSLNTDTVIRAEEHLTADLSGRLNAARTAADRGALVGFHFHPMVYYKGWEDEYKNIFSSIQEMFSPEEVALISIGTLTFIKPVIKQLRRQKIRSKILQMPLEDAGGKLSYPRDIKVRMFKTLYDSFSPLWKKEVFFYMCMEDDSLWPEVFGYKYDSNDEFESAMKSSYMKKIDEIRLKRGIITYGSLDGRQT